MKKILILSILVFAAPFVFAQNQKEDETLYALGYQLGNNVREQFVISSNEEYKALSQGMLDSLLKRNPKVKLEDYQQAIQARYEADSKKVLNQRKIQQNQLMDKIKKEKTSKELANGAVIKITQKGKGKQPKATDKVKVHYEGTLPDGKVFDSSIKRGQAAEFALNQVISCWTLGLQEMKVGSKAKLYCPPATAYGDRQAGPIPAGSLLIFDVELLGVEN
ncbi:MAG: FKBP-type peptidyl-prolyl cis-trans isomerase [Elusimicrobiaceae bacterium]|nr:FKBP-type peptidyl-prolyl cis-trans isomerase [Elusimicrobiaceae bacterium]